MNEVAERYGLEPNHVSWLTKARRFMLIHPAPEYAVEFAAKPVDFCNFMERRIVRGLQRQSLADCGV
ncbi:hypothetical protein PYH37_006168 (plasmid) [Sinorhizobium numidicum]|uniref:Uncharacterized protein n=1 Tax=Sinorhizobium numidicum TaxID=680248 RepID=A0ABY8D6J0_9HYPH|nr:hypothetical protein [Sinorhizobium numidicum]WEX79307.1 hypothetical protein PYH37_006168 [Sinorhizobium numidicum]WEX85322.1 hypothetical protein PYH38_006217 [Sinorhizobium numidicum]